ncbi:acyltransferase family protein [Paraburkholderia sp.]|uniref:acyltransferase family protein n=1 Tax=Paraburkholderia sp. TaxID=1926495 RepID=UPI003D6E5F69
MRTGERRHTFEFVNGLRGLAAFQVVALHYCSSFLPFFAKAEGPAHYGIEAKLSYSPAFFLIDGYSAVYLFFLMSGFVLAPSFISSDAGIVRQVANRFTRLYVPVAGALALALALSVLLPSAKDFVAQESHSGWVRALFENPLTLPSVLREFVLNSMLISYQGTSIFDRVLHLTSITQALDPPLWTIHIEFWGSILIILVCIAYRQLPKRLFWFLFALLLVCFGASYFSLFLAGFAISAARERLLKCDGRIYQAVGIAMIVIAVVVSSTVHPQWFGQILAVIGKISMAQVQGPHVVQRELCTILLFLGVILLGVHRRWLETPGLLWLGRISFSLYLVHFPLLFTGTFLVFKVLAAHLPYGVAMLIASAIMLPITLAVAHYFEKYVDRAAIGTSRGIAFRFRTQTH